MNQEVRCAPEIYLEDDLISVKQRFQAGQSSREVWP